MAHISTGEVNGNMITKNYRNDYRNGYQKYISNECANS